MSDQKNTNNVVWHHATVTRDRRNKQNCHKSVVLWFTRLSGSGKSTLAHAVEEELHQIDCRTFVLDGDNIRHGLNGDLDFSDEDRKENLRRVGEVRAIFKTPSWLNLIANKYGAIAQLGDNVINLSLTAALYSYACTDSPQLASVSSCLTAPA